MICIREASGVLLCCHEPGHEPGSAVALGTKPSTDPVKNFFEAKLNSAISCAI